MELIDLGHLGNFFWIVAMMRQRMVRVGDADFRIGSIAGFTSELKGDDARHIALQGEQLKIEHQPSMVGIEAGTPTGRSRSGSGFSLVSVSAF